MTTTISFVPPGEVLQNDHTSGADKIGRDRLLTLLSATGQRTRA